MLGCQALDENGNQHVASADFQETLHGALIGADSDRWRKGERERFRGRERERQTGRQIYPAPLTQEFLPWQWLSKRLMLTHRIGQWRKKHIPAGKALVVASPLYILCTSFRRTPPIDISRPCHASRRRLTAALMPALTTSPTHVSFACVVPPLVFCAGCANN